MNNTVKIEIGFIDNRLVLDLPIEDFNNLTMQIKDQKPVWSTVYFWVTMILTFTSLLQRYASSRMWL